MKAEPYGHLLQSKEERQREIIEQRNFELQREREAESKKVKAKKLLRDKIKKREERKKQHKKKTERDELDDVVPSPELIAQAKQESECEEEDRVYELVHDLKAFRKAIRLAQKLSIESSPEPPPPKKKPVISPIASSIKGQNIEFKQIDHSGMKAYDIISSLCSGVPEMEYTPSPPPTKQSVQAPKSLPSKQPSPSVKPIQTKSATIQQSSNASSKSVPVKSSGTYISKPMFADELIEMEELGILTAREEKNDAIFEDLGRVVKQILSPTPSPRFELPPPAAESQSRFSEATTIRQHPALPKRNSGIPVSTLTPRNLEELQQQEIKRLQHKFNPMEVVLESPLPSDHSPKPTYFTNPQLHEVHQRKSCKIH